MRIQSLSPLFLSGTLRVMAMPVTNGSLPVVDLGYDLHQAIVYNETLDTYVFQNIRYAQSPTEDLRWRAPVPPAVDRSIIQNGVESRVCPQGLPAWQSKAFGPIVKYQHGAPYTLQNWEADIANATVPNIDFTAGNNEDCLFLDVVTPSKVLGRATEKKENLKNGAAVLVWIHGGGWVLGSKTEDADPITDVGGLMKYGNLDNDSGMIFVGINYRLGALGWLAAKSVEENGDLNAGFLDQRLALQWVQSNIHLFGGDASRVTIMGESAGGGNVMLHYTTDPHTQNPLFSQIVPQSPGTIPTFTEFEKTYTGFLTQLNVTSLAGARQASSSAIIAANAQYIGSLPPTSYGFNPVLDKKVIKATPREVLSCNKTFRPIKVLTGVNSFEGSFFYDPTVKSEPAFLAVLATWLPVSQAKLNYIASSLYPPIFDGSMGYVDWATRQSLAFVEGAIYCNAELMNNRFPNSSYAYEFAVTPGIHTQDLAYTFDSDPEIPALNAKYTLQRAIASFVVSGTPSIYVNGTSVSTPVPLWDPAKRLAVIISETGSNVGIKQAGANATRCDFWQKGIFE